MNIDMAETSLTGTAMGQGGNGDANTNSGTAIPFESVTPHQRFGYRENKYTKIHRMVTYGLANQWIKIDLPATTNPTQPVENQRWLTTHLASIPVDKPYLYLTPSEFALLQNGSFVKDVKVTVIHRGNRIAFETQSTSSNLATLNTVQNIQCSIGLNRTGWGVDRSYTFADTAPMVPSGIVQTDNTNGYVTSFYGNRTTTIADIVPSYLTGSIIPIREYFNFVTNTNNNTGVPPLVEKIKSYDGKETVNHVVAEYYYKPKHGFLKSPIKHWRAAIPGLGISGGTTSSISIPVNGLITQGHSLTIANAQSSSTSDFGITTENTDPQTIIPATDFDINVSIEKCQNFRQGPWGQYNNLQVQPSLHVGVQAIHSISTINIITPSNKYTNVEAYFEVICEMTVLSKYPTEMPLLTSPNVAAGEVYYKVDDSKPDLKSTTYAGLGMVTSIRKPATR